MPKPRLTLPPFDILNPTFAEFRQVLSDHGLNINDDEPDLGFISFCYNDLHCVFAGNEPRYACLPISYCDDVDLVDREPFDNEFSNIRELICETHGPPKQEGRHVYGHRQADHYYLFSVWQLQHCRLALLQNEFDIQFGLDLSLKYIYGDGDSQALLFAEN